MTTEWTARYPDLAGKAMVVAAESSVAVEIASHLGGAGALLAVVCLDRAVVDRVVVDAEAHGTPVFGMVTDPSDPAVWARITQHIEQRLGPIDVVVVAATAPTRAVVAAALVPDMAARHRGVLIELDLSVTLGSPPPGVRFRGICGPATVLAGDLAVATLLCASDTLQDPVVQIQVGQPAG